MSVTILAIAVAILTALALSFTPFARGRAWRATVTPLASIIGSGFLICGPLLAREFGSAAIGAEAILLLIAYAVGAVIRFNIVQVEPFLETTRFHDPTVWLARINQVVLSLAYAVSVAYYLKLLAEFTLEPFSALPLSHAFLSNLIVTAILAIMALFVLLGDIGRIEQVAHATVSVKLGVIAGMLVALACAWFMARGPSAPPPPAIVTLKGVPLLLGLLITVQGFETSRFLGHAHEPEMRVRTMRWAQWISAAIYIVYLGLLTPFLTAAARTAGVAGILDLMSRVAPFMGVLVLVGSVASQLSAAVADSIGAGGLMSEVTRRKLPVRAAFLVAAALAVAVVWLTDPFQVVALASRAFALFYAMQCAIAFWVSMRTGVGGWPARIGMVLVGLVCAAAVAVGAPAE